MARAKDQKDNIEHLWHRARRSRALQPCICIIHPRPAAHCAWRANTPRRVPLADFFGSSRFFRWKREKWLLMRCDLIFFSLRCSRGMIYELERRERSFSLANASRKIYVIDLESPTPTYFCISRCIPLSFAQELRCLTLRVAKSSSLSRGDFIISKINLVLNLAA